ncbi:MAG: amidohydrolase family protein [Chloroflexi bacterium]|nr:amidohydrolase family protein [Chloroflexota bacterium]
MPICSIIDTHVHLWDPQKIRMPWLDGIPKLNQQLDLAEYGEHTAGIDIEAMVYAEVDVAAHYSLLEVISVEERAKVEPRIRGIIANAPVEDGEPLRTFLAATRAAGPHVKGIRRLIQGEREPGWCLRPGFISGMGILAEFGYSFDICIRRDQLADAVELVRRCPQTQFIVDHFANPNIRDGEMEPWASHIREMAALPNVVAKVSGMVNNAVHDEWKTADLQPYFDHLVDSFGEDRVMFGGDWSVVLLASSYKRWVEAVDEMCAKRGMSETAQRKLWAENARRWYRL